MYQKKNLTIYNMEEKRIGLEESFYTEREMYNRIGKMSDRELQEFRATRDYQTTKSLKRIEKNIVFFFYVFVASTLATLVYLMKH